ncbi:MAG: serine/threonine protein kinase [Ktedonobacteraceae bacterium]|nr:serine/threonine protein kinase [Ktedonobacteraceae bacterium]MBV9709714.1 serine/threonine protein kinase [Ktedonobacteraceae bacterium]
MDSGQNILPAGLLPQTFFRDRYFIVSKVGTGGFGSVYKATDTWNGDHLVAIKEVNLQGLLLSMMIEARTTFQREADLLAQLDHPNLPHLHEYIQMPGHWYLIMDFVAGETLEEYQGKRPNKRLLLSEVLDIGLQLCTVLEYLHAKQPPIVFRDLKPANVLRTSRGQIYLVDFGIARYFKQGQGKDTIALGSPGYAAPEQYGKAQTTPRADIYSLGAVLHQLLTGRDPSEAHFRFTPLRPQSSSDPGSLTTSMVDVLVNKLEILIASMLAMDVSKRPPDAAYVKQELQIVNMLWTDIYKSFWRPKLGYTQQVQTR